MGINILKSNHLIKQIKKSHLFISLIIISVSVFSLLVINKINNARAASCTISSPSNSIPPECEGQDVVINTTVYADNVLISGDSQRHFKSLTINTGGNLTHNAITPQEMLTNTLNRNKKVDLIIENDLILNGSGRIDVNQKGYPGAYFSWDSVNGVGVDGCNGNTMGNLVGKLGISSRSDTQLRLNYGFGPGGGAAFNNADYSSGGGGGFGGDGKKAFRSGYVEPVGSDHPWNTTNPIITGSLDYGSGGGASSHDGGGRDTSCANGGRGGGIIRISARNVIFSTTSNKIQANGGDGYIFQNDGNSIGAGGGSGGMIYIKAERIITPSGIVKYRIAGGTNGGATGPADLGGFSTAQVGYADMTYDLSALGGNRSAQNRAGDGAGGGGGFIVLATRPIIPPPPPPPPQYSVKVNVIASSHDALPIGGRAVTLTGPACFTSRSEVIPGSPVSLTSFTFSSLPCPGRYTATYSGAVTLIGSADVVDGPASIINLQIRSVKVVLNYGTNSIDYFSKVRLTSPASSPFVYSNSILASTANCCDFKFNDLVADGTYTATFESSVYSITTGSVTINSASYGGTITLTLVASRNISGNLAAQNINTDTKGYTIGANAVVAGGDIANASCATCSRISGYTIDAGRITDDLAAIEAKFKDYADNYFYTDAANSTFQNLNPHNYPEGGLWIKNGDLTIDKDFTYSGRGTILVIGDLTINGTSTLGAGYLRKNLVDDNNIGFIVLKDASGNGGNVTIANNIHILHAAIYAEGNIAMGVTSTFAAKGLFAAKGNIILPASSAAVYIEFDPDLAKKPLPGFKDLQSITSSNTAP